MSEQSWRPLWEANPDSFKGLRRVIMAGYRYESGKKYPHVGEAFWGSPDGREQRWIWTSGSEVFNPLGFQDLPDFAIATENNCYSIGRDLSEFMLSLSYFKEEE